MRRSKWRQYLPYLLLNVAVSAFTALLVFRIMGRSGQPGSGAPTPTLDVAARVASAVPTPTKTLPPSPTPVTYTVQRGDTLYSIALDFDISVEELMSMNGLRDANTLDVGQILIVPYIEGRTPPSTEVPPQAGGETPQPDGQPPQVEIVGVSGVGRIESETVRLHNTGGVAHMAGWTLDDGDAHVFTFPTFSLYQGAVSVHTRKGTSTVIELYWGLTQPVWKSGKVIALRDNSGAVLSTFQIP